MIREKDAEKKEEKKKELEAAQKCNGDVSCDEVRSRKCGL